MRNKAKKHIFILSILVLALALACFLFLNRKVEIKLILPQPNTQIIIDRKKELTNSRENSLSINLRRGEREIIVSKEGYFPWVKQIILDKERITIEPFLISQNPSGQIITQSDPEYLNIRNKVSSKNKPSESNPRTSSDKKVSIWVSPENEILFKKEDNIKTVIKPEDSIKHLEFYKDRNDVVLFSTAKGVYAIELEGSYGTRNFMPVYTGTNTDFSLGEASDYIYVTDTNSLMMIVI